MNYKMVLKSLGSVLCIEAACMLPSLLVSVIYGQDDRVAFISSILLTLSAGLLLRLIRPASAEIYARDGFAIVALGWVLISAFGSLPFLFSGSISSPVDALFETVSGFTTTGSSILTDVESQPRGILFWRSFTHWIGGMGVLVFTLAVLPKIKASTLHIMKAESPGPNPGKLVPKIGGTAKILYGIYLVMTSALIVLLLLAGMPLFDSFIHAFGTAGTGGFSSKALSVGAYNSVYIEVIITVFMFLFGVNFSLYYQVLKVSIKSLFKDAEFRFYLATVLVATVLVTIDLTGSVFGSVWESLRHSSFQVSTIITTTGFATTDTNLWPMFSKCVLLMLMFIGGNAGSTAGGIKCIRIVLLTKVIKREIARIIHPRSVRTVKINGAAVDEEILSGVTAFFFIYILIFASAVLAVSLDGLDFESTFSAVATTLNNVGPGFGVFGPMGNFSGLSDLSTVVLTFCMLVGRLEVYPVLLLFAPTFWKRVNI